MEPKINSAKKGTTYLPLKIETRGDWANVGTLLEHKFYWVIFTYKTDKGRVIQLAAPYGLN